MRSLLFVPGDSPRKFDKASASEADALVLDLEDSVVPAGKIDARTSVRSMLISGAPGKSLWVRINPLDSEWAMGDLAAVVGAEPFGIILPKCRSGEDVRRLAHYLDALETQARLAVGSLRILIIATELGEAMFNLGSYAGVSERLWGITWGAEDIAADLGALSNRAQQQYTAPYVLARSLCLYAAASARILAYDTPCIALDDPGLLETECQEARRDGFVGKIAIHPKHVPAINMAFTPSEAERLWARKVLAGFEAHPGAGTFRLEGQMIDRPHYRAARRILNMG
ncbi:MAG: CoA ester lyase [Betaproteobacteria bacterium]|nr:CoA ester lyase [Betaproteobacteria bacterium]